MRAPDSEYDPRRWRARDAGPPRRAYTRWVLLSGLLLVLTVPILAMLKPDSPDGLLPHVTPMSMLLVIGSTMSPFARRPFLTERGLAAHGEPARTPLLKATRWAFIADLLLVAGTFAWLGIGQSMGWPLPRLPSQWGAIGFALIVAMAIMPVIFAEFLVPMLDGENRTT